MIMLYQEKMIQKIKEKSRQDKCVVATMMYGSFSQNCGDQYSDIEFYIFIRDDEFDNFISREWIEDIEPYYLHFRNEFGTEVVIFKNLIRGEFHFLPEREMDIINSFKFVGWFPNTDSMLLYDCNGKLKTYLDSLKEVKIKRNTAKNIEEVWNNLLNVLLLGMNVLKRGERARALEWLWYAQRYLLQLVRIKEKKADRWVNPTKNLEWDITEKAYQKYSLCTARLREQELYSAYNNALILGKELMDKLSKLYGANIQRDLLVRLEEYFNNKGGINYNIPKD